MTPSSSGPATILITVPENRTLILKRLVVTNTTALNAQVTIQHGRGAPGVNVYVFTLTTQTALETEHYWILNPGDDLRATQLLATNPIRVTGYGVLLAGAPT